MLHNPIVKYTISLLTHRSNLFRIVIYSKQFSTIIFNCFQAGISTPIITTLGFSWTIWIWRTLIGTCWSKSVSWKSKFWTYAFFLFFATNSPRNYIIILCNKLASFINRKNLPVWYRTRFSLFQINWAFGTTWTLVAITWFVTITLDTFASIISVPQHSIFALFCFTSISCSLKEGKYMKDQK